MTHFPVTQILRACLLLIVGFGLGWWWRGEPLPEVLSGADAGESVAPVVADSSASGFHTRTESAMDASTRLLHSPPAEAVQLPPPDPRPSAEAAAVTVSDLARFRTLLDQGAYAEAIDIYHTIRLRSVSQAGPFKSEILGRLETALQRQDADTLTRLVDAYLSVYYDDLDVLLVMSRHQQQSGYFTEAARTFQLAFAYAQARVEGRQQVSRAFSVFVQQVDEYLAERSEWWELSRFYETLHRLDLSQPRYQLRQAELSLRYGDAAAGYALLRQLASHPTVGGEASRLLENLDALSAAPAAASAAAVAADSLVLETLGNHYHLPLRLNNTLNIQLLIDTGASTTTLSQSAFDRVRAYTGFTELGPQLFNTAGGVSKGTLYQVESLQLGRHFLPDVQIAVLDFEMPEQVDGLLGMNVLRHFRFQVDQDAQRLHLQPR